MKIECSTEKIKNAILLAEKITGKNLSLPILNSILFTASEKSLILRSTNLSIGIEIEIPAKVEKEGTVAITGSVMAGVFSNIYQNENLYLEEEEGNVFIKTKKNKIKAKGQSSEDFPTIPKINGDSFLIGSQKLVEGIKSVFYSSAVSDIKPEISSVFIYTEGDNVIFVSTDSFRLAEKKIKIKNIPDIKGIIIPFKNVLEIVRVIGDYKGDVNVCFNKNQISFSFEGIYLTSRLIDGVFPDYRQIVPKESKTESIILKQDVVSALKLSNIFSDKFNQINLKVSPEEKVFEISSSNNDVGENKTNLEATLKGEEVVVSFNYKYFLDCLQSISADSICINFNQETKPMLISGVSDNTFIYLIMPMNR
ncbi:MAG: DNA polymerase III subunit beta [Candidatus Pacebacteria bacterium]|nr:DNA polymerase III subunit beta [Candidatus Paceibacterota bacterium]MCF7862409.1 DNA polymerase III subunit beta [Candidatus Paceibacterota bacterium]